MMKVCLLQADGGMNVHANGEAALDASRQTAVRGEDRRTPRAV